MRTLAALITIIPVALPLAGCLEAVTDDSEVTYKETGEDVAELDLPLAIASLAANTCATPVTPKSLANGRFVSTELGYPGRDAAMLRARATEAGPWEQYTLCYDGRVYTFRSNANDRFVSTELGYPGRYAGMLRARATEAGPWEQYYIDF